MDIYANIDFVNQIKKQLLAGCHMDNQYVVGWGTLALINAGLAQVKNRTGLNWFLLSLALGALATFSLLLVEKR
ncbi:hypothetical protein SAMN04487777_101217 [Priestia aryabhattai B8W22]|nr:hypothetical protein SAMN04487777_101217 [Priestia aryabhattai B8W22]